MLRSITLVALAAVLLGAAPEPSTQPAGGAGEKYTFVIVHGAWGGGWAFRQVDSLLSAHGHKVFRPTLTGQGERAHTGVADRIPERIKQVIYLDAFLPEDGESVYTIAGIGFAKEMPVKDGFIPPTWLKPNTPLPHDVPQSAKTFSEPITLKNPAARKLPASYILTVEAGHEAKGDTFYPYYQRAKARGWPIQIMEGDHNVQWSHPKELADLLEKVAQ